MGTPLLHTLGLAKNLKFKKNIFIIILFYNVREGRGMRLLGPLPHPSHMRSSMEGISPHYYFTMPTTVPVAMVGWSSLLFELMFERGLQRLLQILIPLIFPPYSQGMSSHLLRLIFFVGTLNLKYLQKKIEVPNSKLRLPNCHKGLGNSNLELGTLDFL